MALDYVISYDVIQSHMRWSGCALGPAAARPSARCPACKSATNMIVLIVLRFNKST